MTLYQDERAVVANAQTMAGRAARRKSRKIWALAGVGTILAGGAAFAAVQLFGFGTLNQSASTVKNLKVDKPRITGTLVPGQSVGAAADVSNENDFAVKITGIVLQDKSLETSGSGCDKNSVKLGGTPVNSYPGDGGGAGHQITLATPVTVAAKAGAVLNVPGVVSQLGSADKLCGVKVNFAVVAQVGG